MNKQKSELKGELKIFGIALLLMLMFVGFGFMNGRIYELHHAKTIDIQHEELVLENNYIYCPYCGEKIER